LLVVENSVKKLDSRGQFQMDAGHQLLDDGERCHHGGENDHRDTLAVEHDGVPLGRR